ncbi:putative protein kinase RLK-Pelle-RLCK-VIIa-2 family [Helianthus annuus]|nr:putative protein kinase RLK-Pelle-RLCK-VIIa-2 family [Helianthus annuus]
MFTYDELKLATRNFGDDTFLGGGRLKKVYKGWVDKTTYSPCMENTGLAVAVNIFHHYNIDNMELCEEFLHPNLVKLIGYCFECQKPFFVYEFMHKGNLEDLILNGTVSRLPLVTKVKIVVEIARGIVFLQKPQVNNASLKVSGSLLDRRKILFDQNYKPKLLDYDVRALLGDRYYIADPDVKGSELVLQCNLSGYQIIFMEVLTGEPVYESSRAEKIDRLFHQFGKESLYNIAELCFEICNELDAKSKMVRILQEHDELIRRRLRNR